MEARVTTPCVLCGKDVLQGTKDIFPWGWLATEEASKPTTAASTVDSSDTPVVRSGNGRQAEQADPTVSNQTDSHDCLSQPPHLGAAPPLSNAAPLLETVETPRPTQHPRRQWVHRACAAAAAAAAGKPLQAPPCKHWLRRGACAFGARCFFHHDEAAGAAARAALAAKTAAETEAAARRGRNRHGELPEVRREDAYRGPGRRARVRNTHRAAVLRRAMSAWFGRAALCRGEGVLDIGGGKGELSFEFARLEHVPCTVVDPRPLRLTPFERRLQEGFYHRNAAFAGQLAVASPAAACGANAAPLHHLRVLFQLPMPSSLAAGEPAEPRALASDEAWRRASDRAAALVWDRLGLHEHETAGELAQTAEAAATERRARRRRHAEARHARQRVFKTDPERAAAEGALRAQARAAARSALGSDQQEAEAADALIQALDALFGDDAGENAVAENDTAAGQEEEEQEEEEEEEQEKKDEEEEEKSQHDESDESDNRSSDEDNEVDRADTYAKEHGSAVSDLDDHCAECGAGRRVSHIDSSEQDPLAVHVAAEMRTVVTPLTTLAEAQAVVAGASVLVGMHPDQGAEPLVDYALAHNKPFAVVPCCVYAGEASWRRLQGVPVRSYLQFLDYLQAKDPVRIHRTELDFEGRNVCLYSFGDLDKKEDGARK